MVSIIILHYGEPLITINCIKSVYLHTKSVPFEVICVDNDLNNRIKPHLFSYNFENLHVIEAPYNLGFSKGVNYGLKYATGDVILLLNNDAELLNDAIGICYNFLKKRDDVFIAGCKIINQNGEIHRGCCSLPSIRKTLFELFRLHKVFPELASTYLLGPFFTYDRIAYPEFIPGLFFMFKRSFLEIFPDGKLPEPTFMYFEDYYWCLYAKKFKKKIVFIPDGIVKHTGKLTPEKVKMAEKGEKKFFKDCYPFYWRQVYFIIYQLLRWSIKVTSGIKNLVKQTT